MVDSFTIKTSFHLFLFNLKMLNQMLIKQNILKPKIRNKIGRTNCLGLWLKSFSISIILRFSCFLQKSSQPIDLRFHSLNSKILPYFSICSSFF